MTEDFTKLKQEPEKCNMNNLQRLYHWNKLTFCDPQQSYLYANCHIHKKIMIPLIEDFKKFKQVGDKCNMNNLQQIWIIKIN